MKAGLLKARVKSTGKEIHVYKRWNGIYRDYDNNRYKEEELQFLNKTL